MFAHEALRMGRAGVGQDNLPSVTDLLGSSVVDRLARQQAQSGMAILAVVPGEERATEDQGILDRAEPVTGIQDGA